ncbi:protein of unknown function [Candidatus Bipolaricaulis anaerobius]|uniref:Uncharacterized protein n=1 Tax=Candidatus Bipolaricaulis anaerobius TaxID=2026885 RepID=A0A2X3KI74_9BACT|nr:protein of unknown function [Candidatus Bipolaricaulis anaerobius]
MLCNTRRYNAGPLSPLTQTLSPLRGERGWSSRPRSSRRSSLFPQFFSPSLEGGAGGGIRGRDY